MFGDFSCGFEAGYDGRVVVAFGVGEISEVERGLDAGIGAGEVDTTARAGTWDIGRHAKGI